MVFRYGDQFALNSFASDSCDIDACQAAFSVQLNGVCRSRWGQWTRTPPTLRSPAGVPQRQPPVAQASLPSFSEPTSTAAKYSPRGLSQFAACHPTGPLDPHPFADIPPGQKLYSARGGRYFNSEVGLGPLKKVGYVEEGFGENMILPGTADVYQYQSISERRRVFFPGFGFRNPAHHDFVDIRYGWTVTKNGEKRIFDSRPLMPEGALDSYSTGIGDIAVYGSIDETTARRKPTAYVMELYGGAFPPRSVGNPAIDQDRDLKYRGRRDRHDGDRIPEKAKAKMVYVERQGNPFCIVGATLVEPPHFMLISATGEYHFNLGPNEGRPIPRTDALEKAFQKSAESHLNSLLLRASELPCLTPEEAKQQLWSVPPGCGDGSRPQVFR